MGTILLSAHARQDILQIWQAVRVRRTAHADKLIWRFDYILKMLGDHLRKGDCRSDLAPNLLSYPVRNYLILYRRTDYGIEVIRIVIGGKGRSSENCRESGFAEL